MRKKHSTCISCYALRTDFSVDLVLVLLALDDEDAPDGGDDAGGDGLLLAVAQDEHDGLLWLVLIITVVFLAKGQKSIALV